MVSKRILLIMLLCCIFLGFEGVSAAGFHIPTVDEGLLKTKGCYVGAYLGGNQGVNNITCVNWYQTAQDFPYETQILDHPEQYGENPDAGLDGIDAGINTFRAGVDAVTPGSGKKQLLFSRYYGLDYFPDNNYGKIKYTESEACYYWVEKVLQQGGVPVLILYPWTLQKNGVLDLSANNLYHDSMSGQDIMKYIAQNCSALSHKYSDNGKDATILICFGLEFNAHDEVNPDRDDTKDDPHKQAWRRMYRDAYSIVRANANPSVQMVWAGNVAQKKEDRIWYWPGTDDNGQQLSEDYVDWVGMTWYAWNDGPKSLDNLAGFYDFYAQQRGHPMILMETSADGQGDKTAELQLKEDHIRYLYSQTNLSKYPNLKGIIWFNVIKGEGVPIIKKNFAIPDGEWENHGNSTTTAGNMYSVSNTANMMSKLYPDAVADNYFLAPTSLILNADFQMLLNNGSMVVNCYDTSIGSGITSWKWDVDGDQKPDYFSRNITHRYKTAGTYPITMTISDGVRSISHLDTCQIGSDSKKKSYITIGSTPPRAEIWIDKNEWIGRTTGTKSRYQVPAGVHQITLKKNGYQDWVGSYSLEWLQEADLGVIKFQADATSPGIPQGAGLSPDSTLPEVMGPLNASISPQTAFIGMQEIDNQPGTGEGALSLPSPILP